MLKTEPVQLEITSENIEKWQPLIAMPCYDRLISEPTFTSMLKTCMAFKEYGLKFGVSTVSDSLISRSRNQIVAKFMANKNFTHLMFIDVDLAFSHEDILKLLYHDREVITGAYPVKDINWNKVADLVKNNVPPEKLSSKSTRFVVNPVVGENTKVKFEKGNLCIRDAGTGFMLIKREVFTKLFEAHPELKYVDDTGTLIGNERDCSYALFNSYVDDDGRFLSEDYGFCRYWQNLGGDVWVDPSIELMHLGRFEYRGNMLEWIVDNSTYAD